MALGAADTALPRPASAKICTTCHTTAPDHLRGHFDNLALKNHSVQLRIDERTEVLRLDKATVKVATPEPAADVEAALKGIAKGQGCRTGLPSAEGKGLRRAGPPHGKHPHR